jgi:poly-gamma-glutamate capsule biosynthesis protein CapA/YwtB (metallophosphatase superfamily)
VMIHWGHEWDPDMDTRQDRLIRALAQRGVSLVIGGHCHRPGRLHVRHGIPVVSSLGNFLFDQRSPPAGRALLEVTFFPQGTWFPRMVAGQ